MQHVLEAFEAASKGALKQLADAMTEFSGAVKHELEAARPRAIAAKENDAQIQLDVALYDSAPTLAVPKHAQFEALQEIGHRFLASADGLFVEIRRPWLHLIRQVSKFPAEGPRPPYGTIAETCELTFGRLPAALPLIAGFAAEALDSLPNEHAAWIVWNDQSQLLEYIALKPSEASPGHIKYERPQLAAHLSLVIDIHSHGASPAFFSATDDQDDRGEVKFACVVGNLGEEGSLPSIAMRLCALGLNIPIKLSPADVFKTWEANHVA